MKKKIEVIQEDKYDCAAACVLSIIRYYNGNLPLWFVKDIISTTKQGTSALDIVNGCKLIGLEVIGKKLSLDFVIKHKEDFPAILHVKKKSQYHFVVVYDYDFKHKIFSIMDPVIGITKVKYDNLIKDYLQTVLFFSKEKELPNIKNKNELLKLLIKTYLKNKKFIVIMSLFSTLVFILYLIEIYLFRKIISLELTKNIIIVLLIIIIFKNVFDLIKNKIYVHLKNIFIKDINTITIKHILSLPKSYLKNKSTGEILNRIDNLDMLIDLFLDLSLNLFVNILLIILSSIVIINISYKVFVICVIALTLYYVIVKIHSNKNIKMIRLLNDNKGYYNQNMIETIENLETIKNLDVKECRLNVLENSYINYINTLKRISKLSTLEIFIKSLFNNILIVLIILYATFLTNNNIILSTDIIIVYLSFNYLFDSLKSFIDKIPDIKVSIDNLEKINQIFINDYSKKSNYFINGDISIKDLSFRISNNVIFNRLNLLIKERSKVFLKGSSGGGKSTLLKILLKYYKNYEGNVTIGKFNLKNISEEIINNSITYISQNERLFIGSIEDNLLLGRKLDKEEIKKVKNICKIDEIINKKKFKSETFIEEGGFNLSGGERQRIILARGLLKKCNYIFIDEALSEVDEEMECEIISDVLKHYSDKTIIYVSHKEKVMKLFENIIFIERSNL